MKSNKSATHPLVSPSVGLESLRRVCSCFTSALREERQDSRLVRGGEVGLGVREVFSMSCVRLAMSRGRGEGMMSTSDVKVCAWATLASLSDS